MRNKFLIVFGTLLFIALFGSALHFAGQKPSLHPDAVAGATKNSLYGQRDYNAFLAGFAIPVSAIHFEVITCLLYKAKRRRTSFSEYGEICPRPPFSYRTGR